MKAYTGLQGHGKTYQVMANVIVPALAQSRRVVTNIAGINYDAICSYLNQKFEIPQAKMGTVVHFRTSEAKKPNFFPVLDEDGEKIVSTDHFVQPGDLVVVDECWKLYFVDSKLEHSHLEFFREHRHFPHPDTGVVCDIAFLTQHISDLHKHVKSTIETVFVAKKPKEVGVTNYFFSDQHQGNRVSTRTRIDTHRVFHDPEIFTFYKSYAAKTGVEAKSDSRENILMKKSRLLTLAFVLLLSIGAIYQVWQFFAPALDAGTKAAEDSKAASKPKPAEKGGTPSTEQALSASTPGAVPSIESALKPAAASDGWRSEGYYAAAGRTVVVIADKSGVRRYVENPPQLFISQREVNVVVDGQMVTSFGRTNK